MVPVSVVMAVHNGEPYLAEAVDSILTQTFADLEFVIVDDASTDGTWQALERYATRDRRVVLLRNEVNIGQTASLNRALDAARGTYCARMDADDASLPRRLEAQVAFLDRHPEVGILGTACRFIDAAGRSLGLFYQPETDLQIRWSAMLQNPFIHPTTMSRSDAVREHGFRYDVNFLAQDYELWSRMLRQTQAANLQAPLLKYRVHEGSVTHTQVETLRNDYRRLAPLLIREQLPGFQISADRLEQLVAFTVPDGGVVDRSNREFERVIGTFLEMLDAFLEVHGGEPGLDGLQRLAALQIAHQLARLQLRPSSLRLYLRLLRYDPLLPWSALRHLTRVGPHRIWRRVAG